MQWKNSHFLFISFNTLAISCWWHSFKLNRFKKIQSVTLFWGIPHLKLNLKITLMIKSYRGLWISLSDFYFSTFMVLCLYTGSLIVFIFLGNPSRLLPTSQRNELLEDRILCKICMDREVEVTFLPCGHLVCCSDCARNVQECPMCRKIVRANIRTYLC